MIPPLFTRSRPIEMWAYTAIFCLFAGLVLSRTLYSVGLLLMALYWFLHEQETGLWRKAWFWTMMALPAVVLLADGIQAMPPDGSFYIKLSLPLFPLFFFAWRPGMKQIETITLIAMAVLFATAFHSVYTFIIAPTETVTGYKQARVMQVGFYHDHIRISLAMAMSVVMAVYAYTFSKSAWRRSIYVIYAVVMVAFLHVLTARTGLVALYVSALILMVYQLWKRSKVVFMGIVAGMLLLPILAYQWLPSFRHRVGFIRYDFGYYSKMEYREGSSDGFRFYSLISGWDNFAAHPWTGVGFRGLHDANRRWFTDHFPQVREGEIIQPSSEFLIHAAAAGIMGFLVFMAFAFTPVAIPMLRRHAWFVAIYGAMAATWFFEILPENQYGIFITGYFLALAWWLAEGNEKIVGN